MLMKLMKTTVFGMPILFIALFAGCIFVKSRLFVSPITVVSLVFMTVIVSITRYKNNSWAVWLISIFVTAFILRSVFIRIWPITPLSDCKTAYEFSLLLSETPIKEWHEIFAANLYYYEVWPMHIPFVIFQTVCLKVLGGNIWSIQIVNAFFSAVTCVFVALCAEGLTKNKRVGIIAGSLMCFNVTTLFMSGFMVNQQVSTCFFVIFLYFIVKKPCRRDCINYVWAGILLAVGHLMRPEMYIVVLAVICMFIYELVGISVCGIEKLKLYFGVTVKRLLSFIITFFVILNVTNTVLIGLRWTNNSIIGSKLTYKLMIGLNQETEGRFLDSDYPLAANDTAVKEILAERLSSPADTAELMIKKLCFQFSSYNYWWLQADKGGEIRQFVINNIFEPSTQSYMFFIMMFALFASLKVYKRATGEHAVLYIIFMGYICAFALMEVQQRYAYINVPIFTILGSLIFDTKKTRDEEC